MYKKIHAELHKKWEELLESCNEDEEFDPISMWNKYLEESGMIKKFHVPYNKAEDLIEELIEIINGDEKYFIIEDPSSDFVGCIGFLLFPKQIFLNKNT